MTATAQATTAEFGRSRKRKEDARLITGRTRWTDNITLPGMLHLAVVRSPLAHAKITRISTDAAKRLPGVHGVFTAADLGARGIVKSTSEHTTQPTAGGGLGSINALASDNSGGAR